MARQQGFFGSLVRTLGIASLALAIPPTGLALEEAIAAEASALSPSYYQMRDARVCAALDPRTDIREYGWEVERTESLIVAGWRQGRGAELSNAKIRWEDDDAVSDKICPFQIESEITQAEPSIEIYRAANDALEAALGAEAN